ncbi:MAG: C4-dicarboxylate ABC transporter substrate-binding protein [Rhodocyclaceae bacterium]|nr:C4-dicarboxylate ABC transporter substrate-binding protein [Rhodocyclaceae bacterium]
MFGTRAWLLVVATIAGAVALFALAFGTIRPAPPERVTMVTGEDGGAYRHFAERYREALRAQGIELVLLASSGSVENLRRIKTDGTIDLALIQGGIANEPESSDLVQLGSMFPEPFWIFHHGADVEGRLDTLAGRRIAIGPPGSGTQLMALQILGASGIPIDSGRLLSVSGRRASEMLLADEVDAATFVAAVQAPAVKALLADPASRLYGLELVYAYKARFHHLDVLEIPAGTFDLVDLRPARTLHLLGTSAVLVARRDLHPAVISLLLQIGREIHGDADLFQARGEYPSVRDGGLPLSAQARRFYDSGPPFLQRYLPFWLAVMVDRLLVALLPTLALLIPLLRVAPPIYAWRMRARIYRWYGELKFLEAQIRSRPASEHDALLARLNEIEDAANRAKVPLAYAHELYTLREHVALVRREALSVP